MRLSQQWTLGHNVLKHFIQLPWQTRWRLDDSDIILGGMFFWNREGTVRKNISNLFCWAPLLASCPAVFLWVMSPHPPHPVYCSLLENIRTWPIPFKQRDIWFCLKHAQLLSFTLSNDTLALYFCLQVEVNPLICSHGRSHLTDREQILN